MLEGRDDFLEKLREIQESSRPRNITFAEWYQETELRKASQKYGPGYNPGVGMMGRSSNVEYGGFYPYTSSRAPTGPNQRRSGEQGTGLQQMPQRYGVPSGVDINAGPSKYDFLRRDQPSPWIDDVDMGSIWYSPMEPVWPFGPPYYDNPREWSYPVGYNLNYIPQRMAMFDIFRSMRQSWGVMATVEATRMDQLLRIPWTIQRRDKPRATSTAVEQMRKFFKRPDGKLTYSQWSRKLMFDLFDLDAPVIYIGRDLRDKVQYAQVMDGATFFPLIDDSGRRPDTIAEIDPDGVTYLRRQPAFQQIIYGLPMLNFSEDEIIYGMMRPRPELPIFGYSPVEQIYIEAMEAIRKTLYQLEFWRSGSMPELMVTVPDSWTPRHIATFQAHFDALLSGNLTLKSKVRFLPGGMKPFDIKNASGESLWSQRDETLIRLVCYAFSVSPTPFIRQNNRATAQNAQQTAQEEGLYPLMSWFKDDIMDHIIQDKFGYDDIEFVYLPRPEVDGEKQAKIHQIQLNEGFRTRNEIREELGQEPFQEDGDIPTITTGAGVIPLHMAVEGQQFAMMVGGADNGQGGGKTPTKLPVGAKGTPQPANRNPAQNSPQKGQPRPHSEPSGKPTPIHTPVRKISYRDVTEQAHEAKKPTKDQKHAGNFKKGHVVIQGLSISIETPKGKKRHGHDNDGTKWTSKMAGHYGYIRGTLGADGDQIDVCIGRHPNSPFVFVIDQYDSTNKRFDEHKVFIGYRKPKAAMRDYYDSNSDGLGPERLGAMVALSMSEFKAWLAVRRKHKKPIQGSGFGTLVARYGQLMKADTISTSTGHLSYSYLNGPTKKKKKKVKRESGPQWLQLGAQ